MSIAAEPVTSEGQPLSPIEELVEKIRRYNPDGSLQSRAIAGSLLTDPTEAAQQALRLACDGVVQAHDGTLVSLHAQSICFHGDTPGAPAIVAAARVGLESAGVVVRPIRELIS